MIPETMTKEKPIPQISAKTPNVKAMIAENSVRSCDCAE